MEINVSWEELRKRKLFVATPMYGGQCSGLYTRSMQELSILCARHGIHLQVYYLFNESLITRARAYACAEFMKRTECTHMLFIDSDIRFSAQDVLTLLALQSDESPYDIIGGAYPKKSISWEKIAQAVNSGAADESPENLEQYVGDFVFNPVVDASNPQQMIPLSEPVEVSELGTGFMMIKRSTFEKYDEIHPELLYRPDHVRTANFDGTQEIMMYFDAAIDPESRRYLSEDYFFCKNVRAFGGKVWLCPWMQLDHVGTYIFKGNMQALASVGAAATVDMSKIGKKEQA